MHLAEFFLSGVCHQYPEHALHLQGLPLPLCARCTGTYLGLLAGLLALRLAGCGRRSGLPGTGGALALGVPVLLWAVDGVNSFVEYVWGTAPLYPPSNAGRLVTGLGLGLALSVVVYAAYHHALWRNRDERRVLEGGGTLAALLGAEALVGAVLLAWRGAPYAPVAWLTVLAVAVALALVNASILALLTRPQGVAVHWAQTVPYLAAGLAAGLVETGGLALIRRWLGAF